jgi:parallel beta-helix repeat protein
MIVYVDPRTGNNEDSGTADHPFKTITHALQQARANTTIQLRSGVYSEYSGEQFPLMLKSGIVLRGDAQAQGQGVQITGGGKFLSPTWGGQSVTIVAVDGSHVIGLKLTNPNTRGTAIWVETGSPLIEQNTFLGSDREGVFVSGTATPRVRNNGFEQNGGNGISCTRDSGGVFQGNIIRNNGFGVSISDRANPSFVSNQITKNKDGFVINGASEPILRLNIVENNGRDGIVITNNAKPVLNQNTLSQNDQYDLQNATGQPLKVEGNLAGAKIAGDVK